ncbi:hypothetical protein ACET3Z_018643 [Daucus carota]
MKLIVVLNLIRLRFLGDKSPFSQQNLQGDGMDRDGETSRIRGDSRAISVFIANACVKFSRPMHEITFLTDDRPKVLSQLTLLLAEETEQLRTALLNQVHKAECQHCRMACLSKVKKTIGKIRVEGFMVLLGHGRLILI